MASADLGGSGDARSSIAINLDEIHEDGTHEVMTDQLENLNKTLQGLKEELIKNTVRAQILQVELATQFSPQSIEALVNTQETCESCKRAVDRMTFSY